MSDKLCALKPGKSEPGKDSFISLEEHNLPRIPVVNLWAYC